MQYSWNLFAWGRSERPVDRFRKAFLSQPWMKQGGSPAKSLDSTARSTNVSVDPQASLPPLYLHPEQQIPSYHSLLILHSEIMTPRSISGHSLVLRSLCRGKGTLRQGPQGDLYLAIDSRYNYLVAPYIRNFQLTLTYPVHDMKIPVITEREVDFRDRPYIQHLLNREIPFYLGGLFSTKPLCWPKAEEVWLAQIHSSDLESIRASATFPPKPYGHSFYLTLAFRPIKSTPCRHQIHLPLMQINPCCTAA
jgi:hypothetical protein